MKNFIRGMGVGILFTTIVLGIAYMVNGNDVSDEEIMRRAAKLGMVKEQQSVITKREEPQETSGGAAAATGTAMDSMQPEEAAPQPEETVTDMTDGQAFPVMDSSMEESVLFVIQGGEDGKSICRRLEEAGVVQSASDFNLYLQQHALQNYIAVGDFQLRKNMSYEELVSMIIHR